MKQSVVKIHGLTWCVLTSLWWFMLLTNCSAMGFATRFCPPETAMIEQTHLNDHIPQTSNDNDDDYLHEFPKSWKHRLWRRDPVEEAGIRWFSHCFGPKCALEVPKHTFRFCCVILDSHPFSPPVQAFLCESVCVENCMQLKAAVCKSVCVQRCVCMYVVCV